MALERQAGHLKALYRRGLARKGMERYEEAMSGVSRGIVSEQSSS